MRHISNIITRLVLTACLAAGFGGCIKDNTPQGGDTQLVRIQIKVSGGPATRAAAFDDRHIETIDILSFGADSETFLYRASSGSIDPDSEWFDIILHKDRGENQKLVILANLKDEIDALTLVPGTTTYTEVRNGFTFDFTHKTVLDHNTPTPVQYGNPKPLPMWGNIDRISVWGDQLNIGTIYMVRGLAGVGVVLDLPDGHVPFELVDVVIWNTPNKGCAIPAPGTITGTGNGMIATKPTVPTAVSGYSTGKAYYFSDNGTSLIDAIYIGEKDNTSSGIAEKDRTWIVVSGRYDGDTEPTWYRVPLEGRIAGSSDPYKQMDVLRNHYYTFKITNVTGRGSGSEEEADEVDIQFTMSVVPWNEKGINGDISGPYELWVEETKLNLGWRGGETTLAVTCGYPEWTATLSTSADPEDAAADEPDWISPGNGWTNGEKFTVESFELPLEYDYNISSGRQPAYLHIKAGRLKKVIEITQEYAAPYQGKPSNCYMMDWNDPKPLLIPISQVQKAIGTTTSHVPQNGTLPSGWLTDSHFSSLRAQVLWSDVDEFDNQKAVVHKVDLTGTSISDGQILIIPGDPIQPEDGQRGGNALVILYVDKNSNGYYDNEGEGDEIKWSWHIWNTEYVPGGNNLKDIPTIGVNSSGNSHEGKGKLYNVGAINNNTWMDRNLGAIGGNIVPSGTNKAHELGFMYQWGRKDPIPGSDMVSATSTGDRTLYYPSTVPSALRFNSESTLGLVNAVNYPQRFILVSRSPVDWYATTADKNFQNNELWGQVLDGEYNDNSTQPFVYSSGKSVYDPCPEGWRVPRGQGKSGNDASPWADLTGQFQAGCGLDSNYGYWPATGGRDSRYAGAGLSNVGSYGYCWSASPGEINNQQYGGYCLIFGSNSGTPAYNTGRANGLPVRCVAE